jgi:hypothetical protein
LTTGVEGHFADLTSIEEPLQTPFSDEILILQNVDGDDEQVLLKDNMALFQVLLVDKQATLQRLWEEWEETQLELVKLSIELLGADAVCIEHEKDTISADHQDKLDSVVQTARTTHKENSQAADTLQSDLEGFDRSLSQLTKSKKDLVDRMEKVRRHPSYEFSHFSPNADTVNQDSIAYKQKKLQDMYKTFQTLEDD